MKEKHWYFSKRKWIADPKNANFHHLRWPKDADGERVSDDFFDEREEVGTTEISGYYVSKDWCVYK